VIFTLAISSLACLPPHFLCGGSNLNKKEAQLKGAFPLGMTLENARLALKKRKLDFEEHTYDSQQVVLLPWGHVKITIIPGIA
jgi:hypothetical protein